MKITKLKITNFQQFKNFELDLTYPKGHPKAGKPLDRVCFIGQSGTGKTTLLKRINKLICSRGHLVSNNKKSTYSIECLDNNEKILLGRYNDL